jgi:hypothetical protein
MSTFINNDDQPAPIAVDILSSSDIANNNTADNSPQLSIEQSTSAILITIQQPVTSFVMQAHEVGANKPYVDLGLAAHQAQTTLVKAIDYLADYFTDEPLHLAIEGHTLELLEQTDAYPKLQELVARPQTTLVALPYYGSMTIALTDDALRAQLTQAQESYAQAFGKQAQYSLTQHPFAYDGLLNFVHTAGSGTYTLEFHEPTKSIQLASFTSAYTQSPEDQLLVLDALDFLDSTKLTDIARIKDTSKIISINDLAKPTVHSMFTLPSDELFDHLTYEMKSLYPYIVATQDEELQANFALLAQPQALYDVKESVYEHYASYMNILNDMAHKLRCVALSQKGEFENTATLVDNPSQHVAEVFSLQQ